MGRCGEYDIIREGEDITLKIDCEECTFFPSIEDNPAAMILLLDILVETGPVTRIIFVQKRDYEYDYNQALMLVELAETYKKLVKEKQNHNLIADQTCRKYLTAKYAELQNIIYQRFKSDPIGAYVMLKRIERKDAFVLEQKSLPREGLACLHKFLNYTLHVTKSIEKTQLMKIAGRDLAGFKIGDRSIYRKIFSPTIKPDFMFTKLMATYPPHAEELESYTINDTEITIFALQNSVQYLYHIIPPEFKLTEEKYELLDAARSIMAEHKPEKQEFTDPERMRQVFTRVGMDLIEELASSKRLLLREKEKKELTNILVRYTVGFGLIEVLLEDEKIQDISINSPMGSTPLFIIHQDFGDCITNIIPTMQEAESWASKLRLVSGRPLDEANPVLDTELVLPQARARVAAVTAPLNPTGLAYSIRRHRDKPWTLPLFIEQKFMTPLAAGILSFLIDGARTMLIAGTRSSGKSSLLGSLLVEIMRRVRIITIEDSVTGDAEMIVQRNGRFIRTTIGKLIDELIENHEKWYNLTGHEIIGNKEGIKIFAMTKEGKIKLATPTKFIRHNVTKPIYKITTRTGREIKVTEDHSLFTLKGTKITEILTKDIKKGTRIAVPRILPVHNTYHKGFNILKTPLEQGYIVSDKLPSLLKNIKQDVLLAGFEHDYAKVTILKWILKGILPLKIAKELDLQDIECNYKYQSNSYTIPSKIHFSKDFLTFIGLWIADGCYDKNSVIMSVSSPEEQNLVREVAKKLGFNVKKHSDQFSLMIHSKTLKIIMRDVLKLKGNAYTKRMPCWVFTLSPEQIGWVLQGMFSGDGCASTKEIVIPLASKNLLKDIQTLLSIFNIRLRIGKMRKDKTINAGISTVRDFKLYNKHIGFLQQTKKEKLKKLCAKISVKDVTDTIPISLEKKKLMEKNYPGFRGNYYVYNNSHVGRTKLQRTLQSLPQNTQLLQDINKLAHTDIFWDEVRSIEQIKFKGYVYDISVPGCESFVANNIVAHNTLELPTKSLRNMGYNIQSLKVASALGKSDNEVSADAGIRTTLRLGDSALIVGEVRSSLRGNQEVVIVKKGKTKRIPIQELYGKDVSTIFVPTLTHEYKMELKKLTGIVKHPKRKKLLKITTKTGREVTVTPDHSVFTIKDFKVAAIKTDQLHAGDSLVIPSKMPSDYNNIQHINLLEFFKDTYRVENAEQYIRKSIKKLGWKKASKICKIKDIYIYLLSTQKTRIPITSFLKLMKTAKIKYSIEDLRVKKGTSKSLPALLPVNENFLKFIGYYLAEGNSNSTTLQITNSKPKIIEDIYHISRTLFGIEPRKREIQGLGTSTQIFIQCKPLQELLHKLGCGKTSKEKRVPAFVYGLSQNKISALLKGMYSGDGSFSSTKKAGNMIRYFSTSKKLVEDVIYLLLSIGIVGRIIKRERTKKNLGNRDIFYAEFKQRKYVKKFLQQVGFTHKCPKITKKSFAHSKEDSVSFSKKELEKTIRLSRKYRHLRRTLQCSKEYLKEIVNETKCDDNIYNFAHGDFFIDKIKSVEVLDLKKAEYVYDLSVKSTERFIGGFGGILLHNTEALALYEAMRVGALANTVAGTIHGDSPYGVFDRVVNDLKVPRTSFKATDIIVVANPIRSPDGLHRWRRVTRITEVRKEWEEDPLKEGGFVDLMKYNAVTDQLEPTNDLLNGDSEVLKSVAANVKEWAGNWDAVWENILLRSKIKETLCETAKKTGRKELLEAEFVVVSNDQFHRISEEVQQQTGHLDSKKIFFHWNDWLQRNIKKEEHKEWLNKTL